jgi:hypothetical protein
MMAMTFFVLFGDDIKILTLPETVGEFCFFNKIQLFIICVRGMLILSFSVALFVCVLIDK